MIASAHPHVEVLIFCNRCSASVLIRMWEPSIETLVGNISFGVPAPCRFRAGKFDVFRAEFGALRVLGDVEAVARPSK